MRKLRFQPLSKIASIAVGGVHLVWTGELEPFGTGLLMTGTAQKLNPTQGQDLPKESLRLASALVQPGGVGRGGGGGVDRPGEIPGTPSQGGWEAQDPTALLAGLPATCREGNFPGHLAEPPGRTGAVPRLAPQT